jgi:hypothetical protein
MKTVAKRVGVPRPRPCPRWFPGVDVRMEFDDMSIMLWIKTNLPPVRIPKSKPVGLDSHPSGPPNKDEHRSPPTKCSGNGRHSQFEYEHPGKWRTKQSVDDQTTHYHSFPSKDPFWSPKISSP